MITAQKRDAARQGQFYFRKTLKKCEWMVKLVFFYVTEDIRELSRYCHPNAVSRESRRTGADLGGGCRGCAPPLEMTCGFLIQLVFCKKKKLSWIRPCRTVCFYSIARHFWVPKILRFKIRSNAKPLIRRRIYSHEIKNKIKVDIKVSVLTLEATPLAYLRSLPSIESVRQHSEIISRNGGGGWGAGVQYARFLPLISANTFTL